MSGFVLIHFGFGLTQSERLLLVQNSMILPCSWWLRNDRERETCGSIGKSHPNCCPAASGLCDSLWIGGLGAKILADLQADAVEKNALKTNRRCHMRLHWDVTKAGGTIICGGAEVREQLVGMSHRAPNPLHLPPMDFWPSRALRGRSALFLLQWSTIPRWMPQSWRTGQGPSHYSVLLAYGQRDDADRTYLWILSNMYGQYLYTYLEFETKSRSRRRSLDLFCQCCRNSDGGRMPPALCSV